ncbi:hypothetical protein [Micromonospora sp. A202]|uniref:hypothetical protein n=1 Tax=Micromonospora sp. A202 TaxID=2572899 RepID=UPI00163AC9AC|nr:hypothetical protein [Micromonospora sp. A202]
MTLASVDETAALAGLPAEPSAHGMPAAAYRRRPASRAVFTAAPAAGSSRPKRRSVHDPAVPPADPAPDNRPDGDAPTVWSTP